MTTRNNLVPIAAAAEQLGKSPATVKRWLRKGAPQARPGRRGRGRQTLVDVQAIKAWDAARTGRGDSTAALEAFAAQMPEVIADAIWATFLLCRDRPVDRRTLPGALVAAWYATAKALRDHIAVDAPNTPDICSTSAKLEQLMRYLDPDR